MDDLCAAARPGCVCALEADCRFVPETSHVAFSKGVLTTLTSIFPEGVRVANRYGLMTADPVDQVRALLRRIDELCREAAEIREDIDKAGREKRPWPDPRRVSGPFTDSFSRPKSPQ